MAISLVKYALLPLAAISNAQAAARTWTELIRSKNAASVLASSSVQAATPSVFSSPSPTPIGAGGKTVLGGQRPCCEALRLQREADQGKGQIEVTLSIGMCDSVGVGLPEGSAAVIVPGTHVDLGAAVQLTGGFDVHDVLHSSASFLVLVCFVYGTLSVDVIVANPER